MPHATRMHAQTAPIGDGLNNPPYTTSVDVTLCSAQPGEPQLPLASDITTEKSGRGV